MAKVVLGVLAGALLIAGVLLLVLPISHSLSLPSNYGSESIEDVWGRNNVGSPGAAAPIDNPVYAMLYPVDCGSAMGSGPPTFSRGGSFLSDPCAEPIRNRRIAGGLALTLGVVALVASIRIERRPKPPLEEAGEPAAGVPAPH